MFSLVGLLAAAAAVVAAPATPASAVTGFVSDGFSDPTLGSHWEVVRPLGAGSASVAAGRLELSVPAGTNHDPWTSNDSVRAVQTVADEDLSVEAHFESVPAVRYQMQGLTVTESSASFLRYEVHHDGSQLKLFASTTVNGSPRTRVSTALPSLSQVYLRLVRTGDTWTLLWSEDGAAWSTSGSFTHPMAVTTVGPFVGNYASDGDAPAFTALVDYVVDNDGSAPPDPPADTTPPQVSGASVMVSATTAQVQWATDEPATGLVEYGPTTAYGSTSELTTLGTTHNVLLGGLSPDTTYHYRIVASDPADNSTATAGATFTTEAESAVSSFVSDHFSESTIGSYWELVRPLGVGSATVDGGQLALSVPAGVNHDPWRSNDSVRVVQAVADEDLSVEARFTSVPTSGYQMQGITVAESATSFLRYEVHHNGSQLRLFASTTVNGSPRTRLNVAMPSVSAVHLWLVRSGDEWTLQWSPDGENWSVGGSFVHAMAAASVGPFAGNYASGGDAPAFTAQVDYVVDPTGGSSPPPPDPDDTVAPQVRGTSVTASDTTAQVSFATDEPATGRVEYGVTTQYGSTAGPTPTGTGHGVILTALAPDTTYHYRIVATDLADNTTVTGDATFTTRAANSGPVIDVWYGERQRFGSPAYSQDWVNVLGNVSDPDGVASLTYSLNGGQQRSLSIGPDQRRLQWPGDFNIDIPAAELTIGDNTVTITARDSRQNVSSRDVAVVWQPTGIGLPYVLDWTTGASITDQAQVVDGKWTVTAAGVQTQITGYDRLIAVGDTGWSDYELTVPVTVHALGPAAYTYLSGAPVIGVGMRWHGHTAVDSAQPGWGWYPTGAFAWYRFYENGGRFVLTGNNGSPVKYTHPSFAIGITYQLKVRAQTMSGQSTRYQVKLWPEGAAEPDSWLSTIDVAGGPSTGAIVLIAHQLDATFGDVMVRPL